MNQNTQYIRKSKSINGWDVGSGPPASYQTVHNRLIRLSQKMNYSRWQLQDELLQDGNYKMNSYLLNYQMFKLTLAWDRRKE